MLTRKPHRCGVAIAPVDSLGVVEQRRDAGAILPAGEDAVFKILVGAAQPGVGGHIFLPEREVVDAIGFVAGHLVQAGIDVDDGRVAKVVGQLDLDLETLVIEASTKEIAEIGQGRDGVLRAVLRARHRRSDVGQAVIGNLRQYVVRRAIGSCDAEGKDFVVPAVVAVEAEGDQRGFVVDVKVFSDLDLGIGRAICARHQLVVPLRHDVSCRGEAPAGVTLVKPVIGHSRPACGF